MGFLTTLGKGAQLFFSRKTKKRHEQVPLSLAKKRQPILAYSGVFFAHTGQKGEPPPPKLFTATSMVAKAKKNKEKRRQRRHKKELKKNFWVFFMRQTAAAAAAAANDDDDKDEGVGGQKHGLEDADLGLFYAGVRHKYAPVSVFLA